jgi:hypothetical protein
MRTVRAKRASQGLQTKYRGTRETGLVNAGGSAALLLPKKPAVKRYRCVSINSPLRPPRSQLLPCDLNAELLPLERVS